MRLKAILAGLALAIGLSAVSFAGDDPSIEGELRSNIQTAMQKHIERNTLDSKFIIFDTVAGELKRLKFEELHKGIVRKGEFFVSCADFVDETGNKFDIDYLVGEKNGRLKVFQSIIHAVNGEKRKYHVE